jgi:hypothetical protein
LLAASGLTATALAGELGVLHPDGEQAWRLYCDSDPKTFVFATESPEYDGKSICFITPARP